MICPVLKAAFRVTRGAFAWFKSSDLARRGFCRDCGTPMIFDYPDYPDIGILVGAFDNPAAVPPVVQYGIESRLPWFQHLPELPGDHPTYAVDPNGYLPWGATIKVRKPDNQDENVVALLALQEGRSPTGDASSATSALSSL